MIATMGGCSTEDANHPSIDMEFAKTVVVTGTTIEAITEKLGESHELTPAQLKLLKSGPRAAGIRYDATDYESAYVWGDNSNFVLAYVGPNGTVNRTSFRSTTR